MITPRPKGERELTFVVQAASALSLGTLAGLLYSVKTVIPSIQFEVTWLSAVAFLCAAAASVAIWHLVFQISAADGDETSLGQAGTRSRKRMYNALATLLGLALVVAFIVPLRGFSRDKLSEIGYGAVIAVFFLTILGVIFWKVVRFLERDETPES